MKRTRRTVVITALALMSSLVTAGAESGELDERWRASEPTAFNDAQQSGRHVLVVFGADWCPPCKEIDRIINEEAVFDLLTHSFVPLHVDVTELSEQHEALQTKYRALVIPAIIFLDANGRELGRWDHRDLSSDAFLVQVRNILISHPVESMTD